MTGPMPEEDPLPRDLLAEDTTDVEVEKFEEQKQQAEPESVEAPDAG